MDEILSLQLPEFSSFPDLIVVQPSRQEMVI